ncbi:unnamed protein product [Hermetia illucens]|uniref:Regulatory protein zeste n=2 Tax=Hermetia illucens TaxID=343691 RepID=A0A7R8YTA9_HERIL|nr:unnamed protein product [Hermetia illucens]
MSNFLKRGRKTSRDQVEMYVHFLEENPTVAMARSNPTNDSVINSLWESLTYRLNSSQQGPLKSLQQWQETFANWRYQLRFKTRKLIQRQGDALELLELSDLEERALRVFTNITFNDSEPAQTDNGSSATNRRFPRRKFTRKRTRSSTSPQDHCPVTRNSMSVDSSSSQIFEKQLDCETNSFYEYFAPEQKPQIINEPAATTPIFAETSSQTDKEISEIDPGGHPVVTHTTESQVDAINKLEKAVNSLNDTLKRLVQVQTDMLSTMNRR